MARSCRLMAQRLEAQMDTRPRVDRDSHRFVGQESELVSLGGLG